jgi:hypothetical protein
MIALHDLLNMPLYKDFNISIHPQWFDMFTLSHQNHSINTSCETNDGDVTTTMKMDLKKNKKIYQ